MERPRAIANLHKYAETGGIVTSHGSLRRASDVYEAAVSVYSAAKRNLVEAAHPRHYRVAVWGSARLGSETPEYVFTRDLAEALVAKTGCDIVTGGGPGIMEAAPEGALRARQLSEDNGQVLNSRNHGVRIRLPREETLSPFLDNHTEHLGFSTRLDEFLAITNAVIVAPGGIGSALELLMALQLRQVGHLEDNFPIVVHPFWRPMMDAMKASMHDSRIHEAQVPLVGKSDFDKIIVSEDIPEITGLIAENHAEWKEKVHSKIDRQNQGKLF